MSLSISQSVTAIGPGLTTGFLGIGGTSPYSYSVLPGGAGGTVNASSGLYTSPAQVNSNAAQAYDTIRVVDSASPTPAVAYSQILVGSPIQLFCDILTNQMGLSPSRAQLWDQKLFMPTDSDLFIAVRVLKVRPFGNTVQYDGTGSGLNANQYCNTQATLSVDLISRGPAARDQKEQVVMALNSQYAESQMELNSFYIARLPIAGQFTDLSLVDGAAIPYRFNFSVNIQYTVKKVVAVSYFNTFQQPTVYTNP